MNAPSLALRAEAGTQLRTYAALLPLGVRDLDETIARECAENPWLDLVERPLAAYDDDALRGIAAAGPSLVEHLEAQAAARDLSPSLGRAVRCTIGLLDAHGYLREDDAAVARVARVAPGVAARAIAIVQTFEPVGLAARTLGERFALQLRDAGHAGTLAFRLASELDALAAEGAAAFAAARGHAPADLAAALALLRGCDAHPAHAFAPAIARVFPEIRFERDGDDLQAHVDGRFWPGVRVATLATTRGLSAPMRQARSRARLVVDALARRRTTLERLAAALLERQSAYLRSDGDPHALVPLGGRDLARDLGCAESTISRAIAGRFAATPFGTVPLRAFLARRPGSVDVTTAAARDLVREILTASPAFTDEAVARALRLRGVRLARRTVTKYRGALGLPGVRDRKRA